VNCRRQKMKCRIDHGASCRRCLRAGVPCIFVPRANASSAASHHEQYIFPTELNADVLPSERTNSMLNRLQRIEEYLGFVNSEGDGSPSTMEPTRGEIDSPGQESLGTLWSAIAVLKRTCANEVDPKAWQRDTIKQLWLTFHDSMPGLHFLTNKQTFSSPKPLLLASMLYCSSLRGAAEVAVLEPEYFKVLCNSISRLCIPGSEIGQIPEDPALAEEWAFQTILGIILAGLLKEAAVKETGIWIPIGYRLILEYSPPNTDERSREWQRLFAGLQIVDLEHASLHLSCPIIPVEAPLPRLQLPMRGQLYRLSRMMHTGLTHFTGRGLPTIWSCFSDAPLRIVESATTFSGVDAAVIRDWARQLDEWLVEFSSQVYESEHEKKLVFRQYILHRLLVLSIYHPARGCNLFSNSASPKEQYELLLSARAAIKLHRDDFSIWSNWDLVMITWAALIVLQGVQGGVGDPDDLENVDVHLKMLRRTNEPKPGLREKLAWRLEQSLEGLHSPLAGEAALAGQDVIDSSWYIFDEGSLQNAGYQLWPYDNQIQ
ncbi:hypothetical protein NA57DRAFT_41415, partial [Rhizodiscina lignyota]